MEHRDQRQENHGVHVCNKCGWPFPNPHPSAKHRRAHKRVCGTIEGFKLVESEANALLTVVSDDDVDHKISSPKALGGRCGDDSVDGMKTKSKESEDEVFSDAVAEFSESVGPNKSMGDALYSSAAKMVVEDEISSSRTLKDKELHVIAETTINQSGCEQEKKVNQEFVNIEAESKTPLSSSSTENQKDESSVVAETYVDPLGNEQETKVNRELVDLETSSASTENQNVENSVIVEPEQETKINQEYGNLETNFRNGNSVIPSTDHINPTTTTGDLYPNDPETIITALRQPQCSLPSPDRICDDENLDSCKNSTEVAAASEKIDKPSPKMEETIGISAEPLAHDGTFQSVVDNDMFIHSEIPQSVLPAVNPQSVVVSNVKPIDLTQVTYDARKELEACRSNNLLETDIIKGENDNVHLPSVSTDLNTLDRPDALVEDSENHKEVKLTNCVVQDPHEGVSDLEDNSKDPIPKGSYFTLQADPFDQTSEVASFDKKIMESRQKQEDMVKNVSVDVKGDCPSHSGQEAAEIPIQEMNSAQIKNVPSENEEHNKSQILSDVAIGIDSIPSVSLSSEVESVAPSKNSLDNLSENVSEVLFGEVWRGEVLLPDDENKEGACGKDFDTVQIHLPVDAHERKDNFVNEKDKFDNLNIAGVEDKKDPPEEKISMGTDSTPQPATNKENKCIAVAEEIAEESPRKISLIESIGSRKFDTSLASNTQESVKENDCSSSVHVLCPSEVNADDGHYHIGDSSSVRDSSDVHANREGNLVSVSNEAVTGRSDTFQDGSVTQLAGDGVAFETRKDGGVKTDMKPQLTSSLLDPSVDAISQTDSLEGNWGSVSVLSTQSDLLAVVDGEVTPQTRAGAEETDLRKADAAPERQHSDRSDLFEPPSFMTLVEPNGGGIPNSATTEIQTARNREQPNPTSLQAGWFPSYTHVANDSPGRKKNEAIIAKVTNWSAGKPHTALKNLLDDAALENKQKSSPTPKDNLASMIQKDEKPSKKVDSITQPKSPTSQLINREFANEWNSPARYPSDIRRERRKGRPYWAQFVCCSSVH
ncbi:titin-like protein isoform X2 [Cucumis melo var. makuwa]|uniref:Titin-like protein isoform X2 n=1 Tax=Cucumis melo var. makuwa TaxID=1194695 RepID=A0A5D3DJ29_CUCMM|nr:titin-like protein isoform X2 [Cucumis melo var. makuwa]TYK23644.1 titin-like protein isoform X2 [Cucumis melo var. makuwa]